MPPTKKTHKGSSTTRAKYTLKDTSSSETTRGDRDRGTTRGLTTSSTKITISGRDRGLTTSSGKITSSGKTSKTTSSTSSNKVPKSILKDILLNYQSTHSTLLARNNTKLASAVSSRTTDLELWISGGKDGYPRYGDKPWGNNHLVTHGEGAPRMSGTESRNPFTKGHNKFAGSGGEAVKATQKWDKATAAAEKTTSSKTKGSTTVNIGAKTGTASFYLYF
ncbi:hypothetical protein EX30DRAFT_46655 [Ascodesmis nigricans]|uniref:Uncharacterized protein n=1 Tax=Ascodesmis nigricans TaxID=341454 RepID=A0A4S2MVJ9_9PEZI|nr:hypothetical protein EX30DRAFT_46655 [Ascodesmis nigricans]